MMKTDPARRVWLQRAGALSALGLTARLPGVGLLANAAAQASDYKALVCVFMFGGNDGNNTVIPIDTACPAAIGPSAPTSARRDRDWNPIAAANSQPMAGLIPWNAPSASTAPRSRPLIS